MIRRQKVSYFVDVKDSSTVEELKKIVRGITKKPIDEIRLYRDETIVSLVLHGMMVPRTTKYRGISDICALMHILAIFNLNHFLI